MNCLVLILRGTKLRCVCWKRWKRVFSLYITSRGVSDMGKKVALILHTGGMALQEVFYSSVQEDAGRKRKSSW